MSPSHFSFHASVFGFAFGQTGANNRIGAISRRWCRAPDLYFWIARPCTGGVVTLADSAGQVARRDSFVELALAHEAGADHLAPGRRSRGRPRWLASSKNRKVRSPVQQTFSPQRFYCYGA